jgi:Plant transposon protein
MPRLLFGDEYMRLPTAEDIRNITALWHKRVHEVDGMHHGSLNCMHTYWRKNCPMASWQQSFFKLGKESGRTIVLEVVADHYLWFC